MEFQDVVRRRKMMRGFEPRPIPKETLERVLRNARRAPSAGYAQGFEFLVLEGGEGRARFWKVTEVPSADAARSRWPALLNAPALILCFSDRERYVERYAEPDKGWTDRDEARWPVPYWHIDTGFAALLMLLTAVDAGLGALFFGISPTKIADVREAFGVPERFQPIGVVAVGYALGATPSQSLRRGRRPGAEVVHRERW